MPAAAAVGSVLEISLAYDSKHSTLIVSVESIRRLQSLVDAAAEGRGPAVVSPYVRLQVLLPDGRRLKAKTCVVSVVALMLRLIRFEFVVDLLSTIGPVSK